MYQNFINNDYSNLNKEQMQTKNSNLNKNQNHLNSSHNYEFSSYQRKKNFEYKNKNIDKNNIPTKIEKKAHKLINNSLNIDDSLNNKINYCNMNNNLINQTKQKERKTLNNNVQNGKHNINNRNINNKNIKNNLHINITNWNNNIHEAGHNRGVFRNINYPQNSTDSKIKQRENSINFTTKNFTRINPSNKNRNINIDMKNINKNSKIKGINNQNLKKNSINSEIRKQKEIKNKFDNNYLCFKCQDKTSIELNFNNLTVKMNCEQNHKDDNIPIKEFRAKKELNKKLNCSECKIFTNKRLYYCSCNKIICEKCSCKEIHTSHFKTEFYNHIYNCIKHKKNFINYCNKCKKNICHECLNDHDEHKKELLILDKEKPTKEAIKEKKENLEIIKKSKITFDKKIDKFFREFQKRKNDMIRDLEYFMEIQANIVNKFDNNNNLNYEDILNFKNLPLSEKENNIIQSFLGKKTFNEEGNFLMELLTQNEIKKNEFEISKENEINIINHKSNITCSKQNDINIIGIENKNDININNTQDNQIQKNIEIINEEDEKNIMINDLNEMNKLNQIEDVNKIEQNNINYDKINESNKIEEEKKNIKGESDKEEEIINNTENIISQKPKEIKILEKVENCESKLKNLDERCITSFTILKNNRILITFKGGIIKFYEFVKNNNEVQLKELLRLEEEEYCFNYGIELYDKNVAICSEDGNVKIFKLSFDKPNGENNELYKLIQKIDEPNDDPIYTIKELKNKNLVLGCWKNILVYQKSIQYELAIKLKIKTYTFCILELSPNEIISSQNDIKTLTVFNLNKNKRYIIKDIESNENSNIICKYANKNEIVFVAYNKGINIVSVVKKCLIKKIELNQIISALCPIIMHIDSSDSKDKKIFGLLCGAKRKIYGENVNYAYDLLQLGFNLNDKDKGAINCNKENEIDYKVISIKERIHFNDINNLENSEFCKNLNTLKIVENKDEKWIFTSGKEDKTLSLWKIK